jgi:hypothetical protein
MSGPKVVRIVTREEIEAICRRHIANAEEAAAELRGHGLHAHGGVRFGGEFVFHSAVCLVAPENFSDERWRAGFGADHETHGIAKLVEPSVFAIVLNSWRHGFR